MNYIDAMQNQLPAEVETLTAEINIYKAQAGSCIVEIGKRLALAKSLLEHGQWLAWLTERVEFSERTAQRFMKVAEGYANPTPVSDLGLSKALLLLQLPEEEREEFLGATHEVGGGEKTVQEMSKRELEKVIRERDAAREESTKWKNAADATEILLNNAKNKLTAAEERRSEIESEKTELEGQCEALNAQLAGERKQAEERRAALAARIQELEQAAKTEPIQAEVVPDEETLARIRDEVAAEFRAEIESSRERAEDAARKLEQAKNPLAAKISLWFGDLQQKLAGIRESLADLREQQPEVADRFETAICEYLEQEALAIGG